MHRIYLDNNATTPVLPEVFEAMRPYFWEQFGNASSIHHHGQQTRAAVEDGRESVAALLDCRASEIVFTSGGTEADNLAIAGLVGAGDHVITSSIEHHAVLLACKHLADMGAQVTVLPVDGRSLVDPADVRRALRPNTKLISVMMANNETGVLQPVEEIGKIAAEAGVYFHTDAVQAAGKVAIDLTRIGCHALSISGHKIHAPQGVGALYVRKGTRLQPLFYGGRHERSRRAGTENVPGIVGLGQAAKLAKAALDRGDDIKMAAMRDRLQQGIVAQVEDAGVNGDGAARVPNTTNIHFDHIDGEAMVIALDLKGVAVSTGAACSSGAIEPSHVLVAMGLRNDQARASIRFSLGKQTTDADIDFALALVPETVARLRELSPTYSR
ncbi:MAG TPA: aminotransferase class V-fold PLP-dependent enzyme [Candidatus Sulfotelmatobacter sp.]